MAIAWARFKDVWAPLVGASLLVLILSVVTSLAPKVVLEPTPSFALTRPASLPWIAAQWSLGAFFNVGLIRMMLVTARGGTPTFRTILSGWDRFLPMLATNLLGAIAMSVGLVLLIVPGIIVGYGIAFATYFVVDANLGPIEALRESWQATRGQKFELFILSLLSGLVCLAGLAACGVGLVASYPVCTLAFAVAFTRATGRMPVAGPGEEALSSPPL